MRAPVRSGRTAAVAMTIAALLAATAGAARAGTAALCGDINESGSITSSDALSVLKKAVGQPVDLQCLDYIDRYGSPGDLHLNSLFDLDYLLARPVAIEHPATVTALGLISREGKGVHVRLALYADDNGSPGNLVVATPSTEVLIGSQEIPVAPTQVAAGDYWIASVLDAPLLMAADEDAADTAEHIVKYRPLTYGTALPSPFAFTKSYGTTEINYWVKVNQ